MLKSGISRSEIHVLLIQCHKTEYVDTLKQFALRVAARCASSRPKALNTEYATIKIRCKDDEKGLMQRHEIWETYCKYQVMLTVS